MKILVIEDDPTLNKNINEALLAESYNAESVYDGLLAERLLKKEKYDCLIMDINLPGKTGFDLCRDFRIFNSETPVIMLTSFAELEDKVKGYDCGADDYLTKPFYIRELLLRVNALIKRKNHTSGLTRAKSIAANDIVIHFSTKKVTRQGEEIKLTPREFQILVKLLENKGELVSKNDLIKEIWGTIMDANTNTIEVYINFLRNKIDKPFGKQSIKTKVGYGYYFDEQ
jgi:DNA-binding response OmpR family regulator